jgi:hypothetical protein
MDFSQDWFPCNLLFVLVHGGLEREVTANILIAFIFSCGIGAYERK